MRYTNEEIRELVHKLTLEEKILLLHGQTGDAYRGNQAGFVHGVPRLGIPDLFIADGESGVNTSWDATALPAKVALAASFDVEAARLYGRVLGREAKACGMDLILTPRVNIVRENVAPEGRGNGGNYQTYGEDPVLNGEMGAAEAQGIQQDGDTIANLKQMFGSSTGTAQGAGNSVIGGQALHEIYLKPFKRVAQAGVGSAMSSYNQVNGRWSYDWGEVLTGLLREQWGFEGPVFDDWLCLYDPNAVRHGVTLEMPGEDPYGKGSERSCYGMRLAEAVRDPAQPVQMEDIDRAVEQYLRMLARFGKLGRQSVPGPLDDNIKQQSAAQAREIAIKGAVLLKNEEQVLPLDLKKERLAIIGVTGARQAMPVFKESAYGFASRKTGVFQVLQEQGAQVSFALGEDLDGVPVPLQALSTRPEGGQSGLRRYIAPFEYDTLAEGELRQPPFHGQEIVDGRVHHTGTDALPPLPFEPSGNMMEDVAARPYYHWYGYLTPPETGWYRLNLQSYIPGQKEFEKNNVKSTDMAIMTTGNLYLRLEPKRPYMRVGIGPRVAMNGGAVPNSEVVPCTDGFNNAGGQVYLEAGKSYELYFNQCCIYGQPVQVRLAWVTPSMAQANLQQAAQVAARADKAIVFAWQRSPAERLELCGRQNELITAVAEANHNTVVVLNTGDPVAMPWLPQVKTVLEMWFSGQEGARATADILTGKRCPGGRLPVTFPKQLQDTAPFALKYPERTAVPGRAPGKDTVQYNVACFTEGVNVGYRWFDEQRTEPLFPFGHGLSYTTFAYDGLQVRVLPEGDCLVECTVRNTGRVEGDEVVQCYLGRPVQVPENVQVPPQILAAFVRVTLAPGEKRRVILHIDREELCYYDAVGRRWKPLMGTRAVRVGPSSRRAELAGELFVAADTV